MYVIKTDTVFQPLIKLICSEDVSGGLTQKTISIFSIGQGHTVYFLHQINMKTKIQNQISLKFKQKKWHISKYELYLGPELYSLFSFGHLRSRAQGFLAPAHGAAAHLPPVLTDDGQSCHPHPQEGSRRSQQWPE